jgi:hypothetical protein
MSSIVPPPNPAKQQFASNGSAGNDHLPKVPNLGPRRLRSRTTEIEIDLSLTHRQIFALGCDRAKWTTPMAC